MIGRQITGNIKQAIKNEWLLTNGLGSYSSSTVINANTRRFHGMLISSSNPPVNRWVLLNRLEEEIILKNKSYPLSTNIYMDAIHPEGYKLQEYFDFRNYPVFTYLIGSVRITKEIILLREQNTLVVKYSVFNNTAPISFSISPIASMRDIHETIIMGKTKILSNAGVDGKSCVVKRDDEPECPALNIKSNKASFRELASSNRWYLNFRYYQDQQRDEKFFEDGYSPGKFAVTFDGNDSFYLVFSDGDIDFQDIEEKISETVGYWLSLVPEKEAFDPFFCRLHYAADQFIVKRNSTAGKTIIAGYPWFTDWGRDTMISLPGLALVTGRYEDAESILETYAHYCSKGMLPNRFPDSGSGPEYNNVDSAYWFFYTVMKYLQYTGNFDFVREKLYPVLKEIAEFTIEGTRFNIMMDPEDGLISAGNKETQLTWMDVRVNGEAVTPRYGKAVEINALWYNALSFLSYLCIKFNDDSEGHRWHSLSQKVRESFSKVFFREDNLGLYDTVTENGPDSKIRPNQLIALFLPYKIMSKEKAAEILKVIEENLYVSFGIRTLHPQDSEYKPFYRGKLEDRDKAYHQGTAWAFLMGFYITAYISVNGRDSKTLEELERIYQPFRNHLDVYGIGSISEVFEASAPHNADGCIAQAWSVGEILRSYYEDFLGLAPELPELVSWQ
jgi:predicted glycogen debranching enzyme